MKQEILKLIEQCNGIDRNDYHDHSSYLEDLAEYSADKQRCLSMIEKLDFSKIPADVLERYQFYVFNGSIHFSAGQYYPLELMRNTSRMLIYIKHMMKENTVFIRRLINNGSYSHVFAQKLSGEKFAYVECSIVGDSVYFADVATVDIEFLKKDSAKVKRDIKIDSMCEAYRARYGYLTLFKFGNIK